VRRIVARGALAGLAAAAALAPAAAAHVVVLPAASRPADLQLYRVIVPNEMQDADTTRVELKLPAGIDFALVDQIPGWTGKLVRAGGQPDRIVWSGGKVPPDGYAELRFIARNPVQTGTVAFKALQTYSNGQVERWIGAPDAEKPAAQVRLAEDATPQDVVAVNGGEAAPSGSPGTSATPAATPAAGAANAESAASGDGGRDTLTFVLALVALVVALVAAGAGIARAAAARRPAG
jgi:uncharacterized protein YcnI